MPEAPDYVRRNAQRGLDNLRFAGDGLQASTVRAARRMAAGEVSDQKARLMGPWFRRHEADLQSEAARQWRAGETDRPRPASWPGGYGVATQQATSCELHAGPNAKPKQMTEARQRA